MMTVRAAVTTAALLMATVVPAFAQLGGSTAPPVTRAPDTVPQTSQVDDVTVNKVGTALKHVSVIRQRYAQRAQSTDSPQEKQALTSQAQQDMMKAIGDQGLSVQQYDQTIRLAQSDQGLRQRLIAVARSAD